MVLRYNDEIFECSKAAKSDTAIALYDADGKMIHSVSNILDEEWDYVELLAGEWSELEPEPTAEELLNAKIDRLQADLDFCLMLLEE